MGDLGKCYFSMQYRYSDWIELALLICAAIILGIRIFFEMYTQENKFVTKEF